MAQVKFWPVKTKLRIAFFTVAALCLFITVYSIFSFNHFSRIIETSTRETIPNVLAAASLSEHSSIIGAISPKLANADNYQEVERIVSLLNLDFDHVDRSLAWFEKNYKKEDISKIKALSQDLKSALDEVAQLAKNRILIQAHIDKILAMVAKKQGTLDDNVNPIIFGVTSSINLEAKFLQDKIAKLKTSLPEKDRRDMGKRINKLLSAASKDYEFAYNLRSAGSVLLSIINQSANVTEEKVLKSLEFRYRNTYQHYVQNVAAFKHNILASKHPLLVTNIDQLTNFFEFAATGQDNIFDAVNKRIVLQNQINHTMEQHRHVIVSLNVAMQKIINDVSEHIATVQENTQVKKLARQVVLMIIGVSIIIAIITILLTTMRLISGHQSQLERSKEEAVKNSKAKSEFLSTMSHELRTPMNGIIGFTHLLYETNLSVEQKNYAETVEESARTLLAIINDVLDFSKIEANKLEIEEINFDFRQSIKLVEALMGQQAKEKTLAFELDIDESIPQVLIGDPIRVKQCLINLINNAIKFTEKGFVKLAIKNESIKNSRILLRFEVQDSGIGVPAHKSQELFKAFNQADTSITRKYGGTGLGLSITKRLAHLMGGEVGMSSVQGQGSTFWFTSSMGIGLFKAMPKEKEIDSPEDVFEVITGKRIVVAEDNPVNAKLVSKILEKDEHTVLLAENGRQVLALLDHEDQPIDLILMDMQMPEMDGIEATKSIRARSDHYHDIPIIALTANALAEDKDRCREAGMDDYITKPFKREKLQELIYKFSS